MTEIITAHHISIQTGMGMLRPLPVLRTGVKKLLVAPRCASKKARLVSWSTSNKSKSGKMILCMCVGLRWIKCLKVVRKMCIELFQRQICQRTQAFERQDLHTMQSLCKVSHIFARGISSPSSFKINESYFIRAIYQYILGRTIKFSMNDASLIELIGFVKELLGTLTLLCVRQERKCLFSRLPFDPKIGELCIFNRHELRSERTT